MKGRKQIIVPLTIHLLLLLCLTIIASSQEITPNDNIIAVGPHTFSTFLERQNKTLIAKGTSYLTYFRLAICSAVLYLEPQHASNHIVTWLQHGNSTTTNHTDESSSLSSIALEISYHKPVRSSDFRWATTHYTKKNGHDSDPTVKGLIDEFNSFYRDVRRDDRYLLEYNPSEGVTLSLNGDFLGSVGAGSLYERELAQAIYSIWFGQYPFFERLKRDLLSPISL